MAELAISIAVNVLLGIVLAALLYRRRADDGGLLGGAGEAMDVFRSRFPDTQGAATVSADRRAALIELPRDTGIGLVQRQGRRWNARLLAPGEIRSVKQSPPDALEVELADFGWPRARIRIADPGARAAWMARLGAGGPPASVRHA
jgi:hypothetical protein